MFRKAATASQNSIVYLQRARLIDCADIEKTVAGFLEERLNFMRSGRCQGHFGMAAEKTASRQSFLAHRAV